MSNLNITPAEVLNAVDTNSDAGLFPMALLTGRVRATVVSGRTGNHIGVKLTCKRKGGGKWERCRFDEADAVFVDQRLGGDAGDAQIGTYYPTGKWAGRFFYNRGVDPARVWAAEFVLKACAGRDPGYDKAELLQGENCIRCGRELDHQDSIRRLMGPDCFEMATRDVAHVRGEAFADGIEFQPTSESAPIERDLLDARRIADEIGTGDWHEIERERREVDMGEPLTAAFNSSPEDAPADGLIRLPAGASATDLLNEATS